MKTAWIKRWVALASLGGFQLCPSPAKAQLPGPATGPQSLRLIFPAKGKEGEATRVRYTLASNSLVVRFEVMTHDINPGKVDDAELYNGNVVELFVCTTAKPGHIPRPYYEFEVSPYNQELQVLIDGTGKFNDKWKTTAFKHSVTIQKDRPGWDATLEIPLGELDWNGAPATLVGNAFTILGTKGARRFYSAYLPAQRKPNFHLPGFFKPFPLDRIVPGNATEGMVLFSREQP